MSEFLKCHPERSEGSLGEPGEIPRCARNDTNCAGLTRHDAVVFRRAEGFGEVFEAVGVVRRA